MKNTATLLISCPDRKGIVASVANFLYENNANILDADEHQDSQADMFFLRTEWDLAGFSLNREQFNEEFTPIAARFKMDWEVFYSSDTPKVAIFVSREEHCLADLLHRYKTGELKCDLKLIISNHPDAEDIARFYNIPFHFVPTEAKDIKISEKKILKFLKDQKIDLVILARYMKILSEELIKSFGKPIINIHHSFLPSFVGAKPYHRAYEKGVKIIGATAHYVTKDLDQGPIIEQDVLRISHRNSVDDLVQKGQDIEKIVLARAVKWHLANRLLTYSNKTVVFD